MSPSIQAQVNRPKLPSELAALIKDVQNFPDSGIAARYQKRSISVCQGQKLKEIFLQRQLIEEKNEKTPTGRLKRIQLTDFGKEYSLEPTHRISNPVRQEKVRWMRQVDR